METLGFVASFPHSAFPHSDRNTGFAAEVAPCGTEGDTEHTMAQSCSTQTEGRMAIPGRWMCFCISYPQADTAVCSSPGAPPQQGWDILPEPGCDTGDHPTDLCKTLTHFSSSTNQAEHTKCCARAHWQAGAVILSPHDQHMARSWLLHLGTGSKC